MNKELWLKRVLDALRDDDVPNTLAIAILINDIEKELYKKPCQNNEPIMLVNVWTERGLKCFNTEWVHNPIDLDDGNYTLYASNPIKILSQYEKEI